MSWGHPGLSRWSLNSMTSVLWREGHRSVDQVEWWELRQRRQRRVASRSSQTFWRRRAALSQGMKLWLKAARQWGRQQAQGRGSPMARGGSSVLRGGTRSRKPKVLEMKGFSLLGGGSAIEFLGFVQIRLSSSWQLFYILIQHHTYRSQNIGTFQFQLDNKKFAHYSVTITMGKCISFISWRFSKLLLVLFLRSQICKERHVCLYLIVLQKQCQLRSHWTPCRKGIPTRTPSMWRRNCAEQR